MMASDGVSIPEELTAPFPDQLPPGGEATSCVVAALLHRGSIAEITGTGGLKTGTAKTVDAGQTLDIGVDHVL